MKIVKDRTPLREEKWVSHFHDGERAPRRVAICATCEETGDPYDEQWQNHNPREDAEGNIVQMTFLHVVHGGDRADNEGFELRLLY